MNVLSYLEIDINGIDALQDIKHTTKSHDLLLMYSKTYYIQPSHVIFFLIAQTYIRRL